MTVVVVDLNNVQIDDKGVGCVADAFTNHRDLGAQIFDALVAYDASVRKSFGDQVEAVSEDFRSQLDAKQAECDGLKAKADQTVADCQAMINKASDTITQLTAARDAAVKDSIFNRDAAVKAMDLANHLQANDTDAAKAVSRDLQQMSLTAEKERLTAQACQVQAQLDALGQAS